MAPDEASAVAAADARFRDWMRGNLTHAANHFRLELSGEPIFGWRLRSISAPVTGRGGRFWLRVVSEKLEWATGDSWTGNVDANVIAGIAKPRVWKVFEWDEPGWRRQRAEVMTYLPGRPCSSTDVLHEAVDFPAGWWTNLRQSIDLLRVTPTERTNTSQERISSRVRTAFGPDVEVTVDQWETVHGDLHWHNLFCPEFALLDWELWGRGPAGTDAATLLCYSLLVPDVSTLVRQTFADVLGTRAGRVAQLTASARLLARSREGEYPELVGPLRRNAEALLSL